jgi:hypothetical protein
MLLLSFDSDDDYDDVWEDDDGRENDEDDAFVLIKHFIFRCVSIGTFILVFLLILSNTGASVCRWLLECDCLFETDSVILLLSSFLSLS